MIKYLKYVLLVVLVTSGAHAVVAYPDPIGLVSWAVFLTTALLCVVVINKINSKK